MVEEAVPVVPSSLEVWVCTMEVEMVSCAICLCGWWTGVMIGVKGLAERAEFGTVDIIVTLCCGIDSGSEGRVV